MDNTNFIAIIPARFSSTRLPGKPLLKIGEKTMIEHVVDRAKVSMAQRVIVATDDVRIQNALADSDCEVCMTGSQHQSGSDRLAEVVEKCDLALDSIVVNVQGDEPFIEPDMINCVAHALSSNTAAMATVASQIHDTADLDNPNVVKVVFNQKSEAMYFSRSPIPFVQAKEKANKVIHWKHIGIYAYRAEFLTRYQHLSQSAIEVAESLEQLRVLDSGEKIIVNTYAAQTSIGVDTEQDLIKARAYYAQQQN